MAPTSTTTRQALLGLLSLRPWTAYELTRQMRRALRWVWPRSEANIYSEIKRLASRGLADSVDEAAGNRTRARYEITDAGRDELAAWLRTTPPAPPRVEAEMVLRAFLADQAGPDDLRRSLGHTRVQVAEQMAEILPILHEYAGGDPPFPERAHLNVLFIHFMAGFFRHVLAWCDEVEKEAATWPATAGVGMTPSTRRMLDEALDLYGATVSRQAGEATRR